MSVTTKVLNLKAEIIVFPTGFQLHIWTRVSLSFVTGYFKVHAMNFRSLKMKRKGGKFCLLQRHSAAFLNISLLVV